MGYIERHLQPGESLLHRTTVHWVVYVPGFVYLALAVAGYAAVKRLMPDQAAVTAPVAAALFGLAAVLSWLKAFIRRLSTELAVTDRRVVIKVGLFSRRTMEMNRSKVESVRVDQSLIGRMLDYGTVVVKGTGGGLEPLFNIEHPLAFRSEITAG